MKFIFKQKNILLALSLGFMTIFSAQYFAIAATSRTDLAVQYLIDRQIADKYAGHWGDGNLSFITTTAVLDSLHLLHATGTSYRNGVEWVDSYISDNNDYLTKQAKALLDSGAPTSTIETLAYALDESTGGFMFDRGYEPDSLTTASALRALSEGNYSDNSKNKNLTISLTLYYLANAQNRSGGWAPFEGGLPNSFVTARVLQSLIPYRGKKIKNVSTQEIYLDQVIQRGLHFLSIQQKQDGWWDGNLVSTLLSFGVLQEYGQVPLYKDAAVNVIHSSQGSNGGFNGGDMYMTAIAIPVLKTIETSTQ